jgi:hypothetical protein
MPIRFVYKTPLSGSLPATRGEREHRNVRQPDRHREIQNSGRGAGGAGTRATLSGVQAHGHQNSTLRIFLFFDMGEGKFGLRIADCGIETGSEVRSQCRSAANRQSQIAKRREPPRTIRRDAELNPRDAGATRNRIGEPMSGSGTGLVFEGAEVGAVAGADAGAGGIENDSEADEGYEQREAGPEMAFLKALDRSGEPNQSKDGGEDDDGVHAGALPVAAAEVQPHAEFIEGEAHGDAVEQGGEVGGAADGTAEDAVAGDGGEQEDAVVEMMDVGVLQEEIHVGHQLGHDEKDADARDEEGEEEADERPAREPVGGGAVDGVFRGHAGASNGWNRGASNSPYAWWNLYHLQFEITQFCEI